MDLLNDYGSSSDEDEKEENVEVDASGEMKRAVVSETEPKRPTNEKANPTKPNVSNTNTKASRRGKKLLSLQAVLPPHIFDQLTQSQGGAAEEDDDEDDEDNKNDHKTHSSSVDAIHHKAMDPGVSRLLQALQSTSKPSTTPTTSQGSHQQKQQPQQQPMGAAFLSSATTFITTKSAKNDSNAGVVRDIHAEAPVGEDTATKHASNPPLVETVADDDEDDDNEDTTMLPEDESPQPQRGNKPFSSSSRIQAAPRVGTVVATHAKPAPEPSTAETVNAQAVEPPEPSAAPSSHKRSRKEMERMLRQGMLQEVLDENQTDMPQVAQEAPNQFVPEPERDVPTHGVRNVATQMYDPSAGATTTGVRGRGKNQINQLLGQAANLELARARGMAGASSGAGNAHRANAKRKYGW